MTSRPLRALLLATGLLAASAGVAAAAPVITTSDPDDLWNAQQTPEYLITASEPGTLIRWTVEVPDGIMREGAGVSPVTVRLDALPEGPFTLRARERALRGSEGRAARSFTVDLTAPVVTVTSPDAGATFARGQVVAAGYSCTGAVSCEGPVPNGEPIDTSTTGPMMFRVTAADLAGNTAVVNRAYAVTAGGPGTGTPAGGPVSPDAPPTSAGGGGAPGSTPGSTPASGSGGTSAPAPAPAPLVRPAPAARPNARPRPVLLNASRLTPRPGARLVTPRPTLRWSARRGTVLYNVQVFRLDGARLRKVVSAFPSSTRFRVAAGRLRAGERYVWRVWPFLGKAKGFTPKPLGVSFFDVRGRT